MPVKTIVEKKSESEILLKQGGIIAYRITQSDAGWKVHPMGCGRLSSRRFWPSASAAVYAYFNRSAIGAELRDRVEEARLPYEVIDLVEERSHGDYRSIDEARGCVAFDRLSFYQIWRNGSVIVESREA